MDLSGLIYWYQLVFGLVCFAEEFTKRKIQIRNESISCATESVPLLYVTAIKHGNKNDVMHYILSTRTRPSILVKHTMKPATLTFNTSNICNKTGEAFVLMEGSKKITSDLSGVMISKVFAYIDKFDDVTLHTGPNSHIDEDIMKHYKYVWTAKTSGNNEVMFEGTHKDSTIRFTVLVHDNHGQGAKAPKNPVNANLTEFQLEMINLRVQYYQVRYAAEVIFFSLSSSNMNEAEHTTTQYIDDEYTPGIFEIWSVNFLQKLSRIRRNYVTWKPVSYHSTKCRRGDQGLVTKFMWKDNTFVKKLENPLPTYEGFVPWSLVSDMNAKYYGINVTFGLPKDGFYNATRYLTWSGMIGSGTPPIDHMSTKLLLTIAIGLGTPGVVILVGIVFLLIKKIHHSAETSYDEIH